MVVTRMPDRKRPLHKEEARAARFIKGAAAAPPASGVKRTPAMIRFDAELLARVDKAARRRGVSRSAWVAFTLSKALDDEEQGGH
jgi:hypothetical protein